MLVWLAVSIRSRRCSAGLRLLACEECSIKVFSHWNQSPRPWKTAPDHESSSIFMVGITHSGRKHLPNCRAGKHNSSLQGTFPFPLPQSRVMRSSGPFQPSLAYGHSHMTTRTVELPVYCSGADVTSRNWEFQLRKRDYNPLLSGLWVCVNFYFTDERPSFLDVSTSFLDVSLTVDWGSSSRAEIWLNGRKVGTLWCWNVDVTRIYNTWLHLC